MSIEMCLNAYLTLHSELCVSYQLVSLVVLVWAVRKSAGVNMALPVIMLQEPACVLLVGEGLTVIKVSSIHQLHLQPSFSNIKLFIYPLLLV